MYMQATKIIKNLEQLVSLEEEEEEEEGGEEEEEEESGGRGEKGRV